MDGRCVGLVTLYLSPDALPLLPCQTPKEEKIASRCCKLTRQQWDIVWNCLGSKSTE